MRNVSTPNAPVQICEACGKFVATLLVASTESRRVLCDACAIEAGATDAILLDFDEPADDVPIDRDWLLEWMPRLGLAEIRIYLWVALHVGEGQAVTVKRLQRDCALQRRTIQKSLERLTDCGLLQKCTTGANDRQYLIIRCGSAARRGQLTRARVDSRPQSRIPAQEAIPGGEWGVSRIAPLGNPESQGGVSRIAPSGGPETPAAEGVLFPELRSGRDQTLPLRSLHRSCTQHPPGGGVLSARPDDRPPSRPSGPSTHPPTPGSSSPEGSPSLSDPGRSAPVGARSSSTSRSAPKNHAAVWSGYRSRVIQDARAKLRHLAEGSGLPFDDDDLTEYLSQGARQGWLWKQCERGAVSSPLHLWCSPDRFLRWLGRRRGTNHATRDQHLEAVRNAERETRLRIAREAAALAKGKGLKK
jgi:hypothetical protein